MSDVDPAETPAETPLDMANNAAMATAGVREASIEAIVIRADGTREDLGVVSYWHEDAKKRALWRLKNLFKGR